MTRIKFDKEISIRPIGIWLYEITTYMSWLRSVSKQCANVPQQSCTIEIGNFAKRLQTFRYWTQPFLHTHNSVYDSNRSYDQQCDPEGHPSHWSKKGTGVVHESEKKQVACGLIAWKQVLWARCSVQHARPSRQDIASLLSCLETRCTEHLGSFRAKLTSDVSRTTYYKNGTFYMS